MPTNSGRFFLMTCALPSVLGVLSCRQPRHRKKRKAAPDNEQEPPSKQKKKPPQAVHGLLPPRTTITKTSRAKAAMAMSDESRDDEMLAVDSGSDKEDLHDFSDDDYSVGLPEDSLQAHKHDSTKKFIPIPLLNEQEAKYTQI
ncbi:hypothetical protein B0H14DRAFT_2620406 [Mycena olivaceomarginata]|nr:hypothetical protein B0H14DRAFT_2620406 [Mycena olivaceomarginata]